MKVEHEGGVYEGADLERAMAEAVQALGRVPNEIWISLAANYPCLTAVTSSVGSLITFFPDEDHPGFVRQPARRHATPCESPVSLVSPGGSGRVTIEASWLVPADHAREIFRDFMAGSGSSTRFPSGNDIPEGWMEL